MKLFVYGTLKRGFPNHHVMEYAKGTFLKEITFPARMYSLIGFPAIYLDHESTVHGELFEVPEDNIGIIDRLEGSPGFYQRVEVPIDGEGEVSTYVMDEATLKRCRAWDYQIKEGVWSKVR
jgi:gamma-glutamylaminecyclotransferase